jgi:hypothetical protein
MLLHLIHFCNSLNQNRNLRNNLFIDSVMTRVSPLNCSVNYVISVSYDCYTWNQNFKQTTPWKCYQVERDCHVSRYIFQFFNDLNDTVVTRFLHSFLNIFPFWYSSRDRWSREARQVIHVHFITCLWIIIFP